MFKNKLPEAKAKTNKSTPTGSKTGGTAAGEAIDKYLRQLAQLPRRGGTGARASAFSGMFLALTLCVVANELPRGHESAFTQVRCVCRRPQAHPRRPGAHEIFTTEHYNRNHSGSQKVVSHGLTSAPRKATCSKSAWTN